MSRREEVAWAAGLFEGEGCFFSHRRSTTGQVMVGATLASTDADVVARFASIVGRGTIRGPIQDSRGIGRKPSYLWRVQDVAGTTEVIDLLLPWMCGRRRQKAIDVLGIAAGIGAAPKNRTHCPQGHPYTESNVLLVKNAHGHYRRCRKCANAYKRRWARRKRAALV